MKALLRSIKLSLFLLFVAHLPVTGQMFEWVETHNTEGFTAGVSAVSTDSKGNVYVSAVFIGSVNIGGVSLTTPGNDQDAYLAKYDAHGNFLWVRHLSGIQHQAIYAITVTADNHILATGNFQYRLTIDGFSLSRSPDHFDFGDTFMLRFNEDGTVVKAVNLGYYEDNLADIGFGIETDVGGNIYIAGGKGRSMFFMKTTPTGEVLWRRTYGTTSQTGAINAGPIAIASDGTMYVGGYSPSAGTLHKLDTNGNMKWTKTFQGVINDLDTDVNDDVMVGLSIHSPTSLGEVSFDRPAGVIGKMTSDGGLVWHQTIESFAPWNLSVSEHDGHIYFTGAISADVAFGRISVSLDDRSHPVIGCVSTYGAFNWVAKAGQRNGTFGALLSTDNTGNIFIAHGIAKDSVGTFQCAQIKGESRIDNYVAKISPFKIVPIHGPLTLCPNETGTYSYIPISDYIQYQWDLSDQQLIVTDVNSTTVDVTPSGSSAFQVSVQTPVDLGCENFVVNHSIPVVVNSYVEKPQISGDHEVCAGSRNVTFTVPSDNRQSENNTWTITDSNVIVKSSSPLQLIADFSESFVATNIVYTRKGACNEIASDPFAITGKLPPGPSGEIAGDPVVCAGTTHNIYSIPPIEHAEKYIWTVTYPYRTQRIETLTHQATITFPLNIEGATISVAGQNECGSTASEPFEVEVKGKPDKPAGIAGPAEVCSGQQATLYTSGMQSVDALHWIVHNAKGDVVYDVANNNPEFTFNFSQAVTVSVSSMNMCGESEAVSAALAESKDPDLPLTINKHCSELFHQHEQELQWFKEGVPLGSARSIAIDGPGQYVLMFAGKCATIETSITIAEEDIAEFVPNVITPNGDDKNEKLEVSPFLLGSELNVFNRWGKVVFMSKSYQNEWNGEPVASGVYFYTVKSQCSGRVLTGTLSILR